LDESLRAIHEVNVEAWNRLKAALADVSDEESNWQIVPEANSINVIVRHLRIEAAWHVASLRDGTPMPTVAVPVVQEDVDAIPLDFAANLRALTDFQHQYLDTLGASTFTTLREHTLTAYGRALVPEGRAYFIAYHNAIHLAMHCGQIRMLRNLYRKTRGEPALFVPDNPTFP
jgi:hypothetical protein